MAVELAKISETIKTMLDDLGIDAESEEANEPIPLPNVNGVILKKVVQWCEQHKSDFQTFAQDDEESSQPRLDDIPDWVSKSFFFFFFFKLILDKLQIHFCKMLQFYIAGC